MLKTLKDWAETYSLIGSVVASSVVLLAAFTWIAVRVRHHEVGAWTLVVAAAMLVAAVVVATWLGHRAGAKRKPEEQAAEAAIQELEVAKSYLQHVANFMQGLRESSLGLRPEIAIPRLEVLRSLLFDAIIQGINTAPGEHIRCALFEPREEGGETRLRVRAHRGHTLNVEHLALHMTSVAGIAFTNRDAIYIADAANDPRVEQTTAGRVVQTLFCIPFFTFVANRQDPSGVLSVASNRPDAFSQSDRTFISACADMIGITEFFLSIMHIAQGVGRPAATPVLDAGATALEAGPEQPDDNAPIA